jgi:hypothetical protein
LTRLDALKDFPYDLDVAGLLTHEVLKIPDGCGRRCRRLLSDRDAVREVFDL